MGAMGPIGLMGPLREEEGEYEEEEDFEFMKYAFGQVPIGTEFEFFGKRYRKVALSMAEDERRWGHVFHAEGMEEVEGELKELLPWKPDEVYWADHLEPAPGQKEAIFEF